MRNTMKTKRNDHGRSKKKYARGGLVPLRKPTNQMTVKAKGAGAATRGFNFKV